MKTMNQACTAVGNRDIEKFIPALIIAMANPAEVSETVHKLSATTFVQAVEAPALSIMVPLLVRGLRERQTAIKRKSAVIIDNMSKLVDNPADAAVFLPRLVRIQLFHRPCSCKSCWLSLSISSSGCSASGPHAAGLAECLAPMCCLSL